MDKKKMFIGLGVLAAVGIGFYFWNKRNKTVNSTETLPSPSPSPSPITSPSTEIRTSSDDETNTDNTPAKPPTRKEKRIERRTTCEEKYGKGKDYRQCKSRVRKGGVAFNGSDFEQFENDYIDFIGSDLDLY